MFSVIIPLYNKAPYIEKAIQSIAAQTFQEFELLVIDDGSADNSFHVANDILSKLSPPLGGWRMESQENQGVSTARNNGVKYAKYNYIAFLDADDWWEPTYLEKMRDLIKQFPEAGIYGSSYFKVKNGKFIPANIGLPEDFQSGLINYFQVYANTMWMPLWTGATVIKRTIFEDLNGFKPQLKLGEDFDLWVRVAMKYPVAYLNIPLAYYNQDVEIHNRAVGEKLYEPQQHMLFTDYGDLMKNEDFKYLFQRLALYGLLKYYLNGKNKVEVHTILSSIDWNQHEIKYRVYYKVLPKFLVKHWFLSLKYGAVIKQRIKKAIK